MEYVKLAYHYEEYHSVKEVVLKMREMGLSEMKE